MLKFGAYFGVTLVFAGAVFFTMGWEIIARLVILIGYIFVSIYYARSIIGYILRVFRLGGEKKSKKGIHESQLWGQWVNRSNRNYFFEFNDDHTYITNAFPEDENRIIMGRYFVKHVYNYDELSLLKGFDSNNDEIMPCEISLSGDTFRLNDLVHRPIGTYEKS